MNKRQKLVQQQFLNEEEKVIKRLDQVYGQSLKDIKEKIENLEFSINGLQEVYDWMDTDDPKREQIKSRIQSKIYQKQYQEQLQKQVDGILKQMQTKQYLTVADYLDGCYTDGFIGSIFDMHGQGVPLMSPIDQEAMVRAVQLDSKISKGLYTRLGEDVNLLKKKITAQVSRSISTGMSYAQTAQQLAGYTRIGYNNAIRIARTEGHRVQCAAAMDACHEAKEKGADVLKQWDAALDARTRESHALVDGEIREVDKPFSNGLMYPGDPRGGAAEVVNCRCALLQRARWALGDDELQTLQDRANYYGLDKSDQFDDFKKNYMDKSNLFSLDETVKITEKDGEKIYSSVNRELVNSKEYHDKFDGLTEHRAVNESIYQESMRMLEHRDGTPFEDMVVLDARTGKFIVGNMDAKVIGRTGLTKSQIAKVTGYGQDVIVVHNHPNSSRISYKDILTMYQNKNVSAVVAVGHDGSVQIISNLNREIPIDKLWEKVYNDTVSAFGDKVVAEHKSLTTLYDLGIFKTESR